MSDIDAFPQVTLTQREVDDLLVYEWSLPTGKTIGKRWKRTDQRSPSGWAMGTYAPDPDPNMVQIHWFHIVIAPPVTGPSLTESPDG